MNQHQRSAFYVFDRCSLFDSFESVFICIDQTKPHNSLFMFCDITNVCALFYLLCRNSLLLYLQHLFKYTHTPV